MGGRRLLLLLWLWLRLILVRLRLADGRLDLLQALVDDPDRGGGVQLQVLHDGVDGGSQPHPGGPPLPLGLDRGVSRDAHPLVQPRVARLDAHQSHGRRELPPGRRFVGEVDPQDEGVAALGLEDGVVRGVVLGDAPR